MIKIILICFILTIFFQSMLFITSKKINYEYSKQMGILGLFVNLIAAYCIYLKFQTSIINTVLILTIFSISISSSLIDLKYQEIPNSYNWTTGLISLIFIYINRGNEFNLVINGYSFKYYEALLLGGVIFFGLFFILAFTTGTLGFGDVRMIGALGLLIPFNKILSVLTVICFIGAIIALILLIVCKKKKEDFFAFGPVIVLGIFYSLIYLI